ncbi:MAG TPA: hypothetical protein PKE55_02955 [Kiritimatiellia bacterium]|nr:hypothetical protein [Kiritimatiellia bacterium]
MFRDNKDRQAFIDALAAVQRGSGIRVGAYCLLENDFHLLVETPLGNLSAAMSRLLTSYTVTFNRRHRRKGPLIQDRFHSRLVGPEALVAVAAEIHAGILEVTEGSPAKTLDGYGWSSFPVTSGKVKSDPVVDPAWVLKQVQPKRGETRPAAYRRVVLGVAKGEPAPGSEALVSTRLAIGTQAFYDDLIKTYDRTAKRVRKNGERIPKRALVSVPPSRVLSALAGVLKVDVGEFKVRQYDSLLRGYAAWALQRYAGCTLEAITGHLNMNTQASVSIQIRRFSGVMDDPVVARNLQALAKALGDTART